jgi:TolB-like protein
VLAAAVLMFAFDKWWKGPPPERSVAVLPFVNMSADEEVDFLGSGVADTILNMLVTIPDLHVASRTSSFQPRLDGLSVPEIAALLGVAAVLEGSVQRQGDRLRITAQLVDAESDDHLWSQNFDHDYSDVFAIQDEIAEAVASALELSLLGESKQRIDREGTDNLKAYEEYSRAMQNLRVRTTESIRLAVEQLHRAVGLDPDFARAHAVLGLVYTCAPVKTGTRETHLCNRSGHGWSELDRAERERRARAAAEAAIHAAPGMSTALVLLGHLTDDLDIKGQLFREAMTNNPNDAFALAAYAGYVGGYVFDLAKVSELIDKWLRLDPLDERPYRQLAEFQAMTQHYPECLETVARGKAKIPGSVQLLDWESACYLLTGDYRSAIAAMHETLAIDPEEYVNRWQIGTMYLGVGMPDAAEAWFERATATAPESERGQYRLMHQTVLDAHYQRNDEQVFMSMQQWMSNFPGKRWDYFGAQQLILIEYGERVGRLDAVLDWFRAIAPHLFVEPPTDLKKDVGTTFATGITLLRHGDRERGEPFTRLGLEVLHKREQAGYFIDPANLVAYLALGETEAALETLREITALNKFHGMNGNAYQGMFRYSSLFEPLRREPEFIALLEVYDQNAAEQRELLQAMDLPIK